MRKMSNPEWFQKLPDNAKVTSSEIGQLFGYSKSTSITELLNRGSVPRPTHNSSAFSRNRKLLWEVKYLRELMK